jgi:hypothetical protein
MAYKQHANAVAFLAYCEGAAIGRHLRLAPQYRIVELAA